MNTKSRTIKKEIYLEDGKPVWVVTSLDFHDYVKFLIDNKIQFEATPSKHVYYFTITGILPEQKEIVIPENIERNFTLDDFQNIKDFFKR